MYFTLQYSDIWDEQRPVETPQLREHWSERIGGHDAKPTMIEVTSGLMKTTLDSIGLAGQYDGQVNACTVIYLSLHRLQLLFWGTRLKREAERAGTSIVLHV